MFPKIFMHSTLHQIFSGPGILLDRSLYLERQSLAPLMDRTNNFCWENTDGRLRMKPKVGVLNPDTGKSFIILQKTPTGRSYCGSCGNNFDTMDKLVHCPVRLACGDVFCYGDVDKLLNAYDLNNCPRCNSPIGDFSLARENIDSQMENCRKALEMEERLSALSYNIAALSLQQPESSSSGPSSFPEIEEKFASLSNRAAAFQLQERDQGPTASSAPDEDLVENVVAALSFLDITPSRASELGLDDLVEKLSVLGLSTGNSATRLMGILGSVSKY